MKIAVCDDTRRDAEELRNIPARLSENSAIDIYETGQPRGGCINMCHVARWCANDCEMSDGTLYRLNRRKRQELKEAYFSFKN